MSGARGALLLGLLPFAVGCGGGGRAFEYDDKVAVRNAFLEVVKECYRDRKDGVLQPPAIEGSRVRFAFLYDKQVGKFDSECVELSFDSQPVAAKRGTAEDRTFRPVWRVLAYHPLSGPNKVMDDQTRRIEEMLQERLKAAPK